MFTSQMGEKGLLTVSSMYKNLIQQGVLPHKSPLWKLKVPLKIKFSYGI
jgi:hypothetical protein